MPSRGAASITRRAASAPARWPAERGKPREVAHRPLPSEMMATWRRCACAMAGCTAGMFRTFSCCMSMFLSPPRRTSRKLLCFTKSSYKIFCRSTLAGGANKCFHMIEIALKRLAARGHQAVLRLRQAPVKRLGANNVIRFFQLACMNAQVAIGSLQQRFEFVKCERAIDGQRADDSQPDALVDEPIQVRRHGLPCGIANSLQRRIAFA